MMFHAIGLVSTSPVTMATTCLRGLWHWSTVWPFEQYDADSIPHVLWTDYVLFCVTAVVIVPGCTTLCANVCQCVPMCAKWDFVVKRFPQFIAMHIAQHGSMGRCASWYFYILTKWRMVSGSNKGCSQLARVDPATWLQVPGNPLVQPLLILPSSSPSSSSSSSSSPSSEHLV